jgi:asparagine synthase (glutamine-hydrolysing)
MCGIAGLYSNSSHPDEVIIKQMNDCLVHRGPNESGTFVDGPIGLASRRLSIVGLDSGRQPIFNEDGSIAVVFNGEIYNYEPLRENLQEQGHEFSTDTDTEILVHLYEERGDTFVNELDGMFAFALWDGPHERLVLARDPMGIKPLYLGIEPDDRVAFASELSALFPLDFDFGGLYRPAIAEYFAFGYIPAPKSAFQNVSKLLPGELVVVSNSEIDRSRFYTPNIDRVGYDLATAASNLRTRVEQAVKERLQADVPLGVFLSGGVDSSIITGVLTDIRDDPVSTFNVGFDESQFDETWAAREVASYHNTDHNEYKVSPSDVRSVINEVVPTLGEPFADSSILPTYVVSQKTREDMTVALSGDGADELFSGYSKYRGEYYSKYYRVIPRAIRRNVIKPSVNRLPASRGTKTGNAIRQAQKFVRSGETNTAERQYQWMALATTQSSPAIKHVDVQDRAVNRIADAQAEAVATLPESRQDALAVMQMTDTRFALPDGILKKVDSASMLNSLEVRVPFLDTDVFEFAMELPTSKKITPTEQKLVLKRAFNDVLPEKILQRGKQGFEVPIGEWFKNEFRSEFTETVSESETDMVDTDFVRELYREHVNGARDHAQFLWAVYVFLRWHKRMRKKGIL